MSTNNCPLCLEEIGINFKKLPECKCSLGFHAECRDIFIANNFGCPFCPKVKKKKDNLNLYLGSDLDFSIVIVIFFALLVTLLMYKIYNCKMCQIIILSFTCCIIIYMIDLWENSPLIIF